MRMRYFTPNESGSVCPDEPMKILRASLSTLVIRNKSNFWLVTLRTGSRLSVIYPRARLLPPNFYSYTERLFPPDRIISSLLSANCPGNREYHNDRFCFGLFFHRAQPLRHGIIPTGEILMDSKNCSGRIISPPSR